MCPLPISCYTSSALILVSAAATTTGSPPTARAAHTANIVGQKLYIFGGNNGTVRLNDLYSIDTQTMTWKREACAGELLLLRAC